MLYRAPDKEPSRGERWIILIFAGLMLGLFGVDVFTDFSAAKSSVLFFLLAWAPLLALHEAGHAVVAALCGWRVSRVVIGFGRPWWRFSVGEVAVEIRAVPLEGFTRVEPEPGTATRIRGVLVYAGGVLAEGVVLLFILFFLGTDRLFSVQTEVLPIAAQALAAAVGLGLIFNLVPHAAETASGRQPNDGLGMIAAAFAPPPDPDSDR